MSNQLPERIWINDDLEWRGEPTSTDVFSFDVEYVRLDLEPIRDAMLEILDAIYPLDIFTGTSGDMGPRVVNLVRAGLIDMQKWTE